MRSLGSSTWRKEWVGRNIGNDGVVIECELRNNRECHDGALLTLKGRLNRLE